MELLLPPFEEDRDAEVLYQFLYSFELDLPGSPAFFWLLKVIFAYVGLEQGLDQELLALSLVLE